MQDRMQQESDVLLYEISVVGDQRVACPAACSSNRQDREADCFLVSE